MNITAEFHLSELHLHGYWNEILVSVWRNGFSSIESTCLTINFYRMNENS